MARTKTSPTEAMTPVGQGSPQHPRAVEHGVSAGIGQDPKMVAASAPILRETTTWQSSPIVTVVPSWAVVVIGNPPRSVLPYLPRQTDRRTRSHRRPRPSRPGPRGQGPSIRAISDFEGSPADGAEDGSDDVAGRIDEDGGRVPQDPIAGAVGLNGVAAHREADAGLAGEGQDRRRGVVVVDPDELDLVATGVGLPGHLGEGGQFAVTGPHQEAKKVTTTAWWAPATDMGTVTRGPPPNRGREKGAPGWRRGEKAVSATQSPAARAIPSPSESSRRRAGGIPTPDGAGRGAEGAQWKRTRTSPAMAAKRSVR